MTKPLRIGIIAGEVSGDMLGAGLIKALKKNHPNIQFEGIAGPQMFAAGCKSLFPMERLSVMGLTEVLGRLFELLKIRKQLLQYFLANPPDLFIGIDAPDFNLSLEQKLKAAGIKTIHYVSPSVWAWKPWRLKKIAKAVDLMLVLFPFEQTYYQQHNIPVRFVGHPLADDIPLVTDRNSARQQLQLADTDTIVAILPGSRTNEIHYLSEVFLRAAQLCAQHHKNLKFIVPMVNAARQQQFQTILQRVAPELSINIVLGQSREVMAAADVVLLASGTATLEAMLLKRPMVMAYKLSALSYAIVSRMVLVQYFALPNLLTGKQSIPEFIQAAATPENLSTAILNYLEDPHLIESTQKEFAVIHQQLRQDASAQAATAVLGLVE